MSANAKKWINRGGLFAVIVGFILLTVGGGDTAAAVDTAGTIVSIGGALAVLIREILN